MFERVYHNFSLLLNMYLWPLQQWWNRLDDYIILGAIPLVEYHLPLLIEKENIKAILCLTESHELDVSMMGTPVTKQIALTHYMEHCHVPIKDWNATHTQELLRASNFIHRCVLNQKQIYVHCRVGKGRSVLALACYYIQYHHMSVEEAFDYIRYHRPIIQPSSKQIQAAGEFYSFIYSFQNVTSIDCKDNHDEFYDQKCCESYL